LSTVRDSLIYQFIDIRGAQSATCKNQDMGGHLRSISNWKYRTWNARTR